MVPIKIKIKDFGEKNYQQFYDSWSFKSEKVQEHEVMKIMSL